MKVSLGIDFGTSGARLVAIDTYCKVLWWGTRETSAASWRETLFALIRAIPTAIKEQIANIAIDGTSSTVLLCDCQGQIVSEPILYNDARAHIILDRLREIAPAENLTLSATSSLAKLFWLVSQPEVTKRLARGERLYLLHQADWLAYHLHGKLGISDYHNALKLGYDVAALNYPDWLENHPYRPLLPQVLTPGEPIGKILPAVASELGLPSDCLVRAGTTDSIAAFIASSARTPGSAVTSLGSTLVIKLLSRTRIDAPEYGIYSHRFGDLWLVGGASNSGGAVLRHFFSDRELASLSAQIDPTIPCQLDYYPLLKPGERFPINDPQLAPQLAPRPTSVGVGDSLPLGTASPLENRDFLYGLLTGIAKIEARGYQLLAELGATPLSHIYTAGGGAKNSVWTQIRQQYIPVPIAPSPHQEAAYGTALLAQNGI